MSSLPTWFPWLVGAVVFASSLTVFLCLAHGLATVRAWLRGAVYVLIGLPAAILFGAGLALFILAWSSTGGILDDSEL